MMSLRHDGGGIALCRVTIESGENLALRVARFALLGRRGRRPSRFILCAA